MNFFKKLFDFRKTKMIDDAVFFHRPVTLGRSIFRFFVVMIIANIIVAVFQSIPLIIYFVQHTDLLSAFTAEGSVDELNELIENTPNWVSAVEILLNGLFLAVAIFYCRKYENRYPPAMGLRKKDCVPEYLVGFFVAGAMIGISLLFALAFGSVSVSYVGFNPIIILFLVAFALQGFGEGAFVGGYFTVSVARDYAPIVAVSLGAVAYSLFFVGGTGLTIVSFINSLLLGFFVGAYMFKRGSIIGSSAVLAGWGFWQECVFGATANGSSAIPTILGTEYSGGSVYVNGGAFGIGGGACATIALILGIFLLLLTKTKRSELSDFEPNYSNSMNMQ